MGEGCEEGAEGVGGGVFEEDVVQERGLGYGVEHGGGWRGYYVGAEVVGGRAGMGPGVWLGWLLCLWWWQVGCVVVSDGGGGSGGGYI